MASNTNFFATLADFDKIFADLHGCSSDSLNFADFSLENRNFQGTEMKKIV